MAVVYTKVNYTTDTWLDFINKFNTVVDALDEDFLRGGSSSGDTILFESLGGVGGTLTFATNTAHDPSATHTFPTVTNIIVPGANSTHFFLTANNVTGRLRFTSMAQVSGANSGFDADLLDGQHGSYYANTQNLTGKLKNETFPDALPDIDGSRATNLNANNIATGTIADARLPATQAGKTFSSAVTIQHSQPLVRFKPSAASNVASNMFMSGNNLFLTYSANSGANTIMMEFDPIAQTGKLFGTPIFTANNITPIDAVTDNQFSSKLIANTSQAGIYAQYNNSRLSNIFTANSTHPIAANGTSFGSATGLYMYNSTMGLGTFASGVQVVFASSGTVRSAFGTNIWTSGDITGFSDARVKENLEKIPDALDKIDRLNGYTFDRIDTGVRQMGVVAQELLEVVPEVVHGDEENYYSVAYDKLTALLIEGVKELREENRKLREDIAKLKGE